MCLAYYAWSALVLSYPGVGRWVLVWCAFAVVVVPPVAAACQWATRTAGPVPGVVLAALAAVPLSGGVVWQVWWAWVQRDAPDGFPLRPVQAGLDVLVALLVVLVLPRATSTRVWAAAALVPAVLLLRAFDDVVSHFVAL